MTLSVAGDTTPELPHEQVARRIRQIMAAGPINGVTVAAAIGMDQRSFSRRFRGTTPFTFNELSLIAPVLGVPFAELVEHEPIQVTET